MQNLLFRHYQKLEENSEKFVTRINDSIGKVLSQVLALPIAAAATTILRSTRGDNNDIGMVMVYVALLAYAVICRFALLAQKQVLDNIKKQVSEFENSGRVPSALRPQWDKDKEDINDLITKQEWLYCVMRSVVYMVIMYCSYKICSLLFC